MRTLFLFFLFASATLTVYSWDKYDHEIFDLVSELEAAEGKGTTFYSFLEVPHTATTSEIGKAYRKKSITMHPDKNPRVKNIHERFARLGIISAILRNEESRKRYDFFYRNGVPKWRGTGYYYSRFRPGLGTVIIFLIILSSGVQYMIQRITFKNDLARIEKFVTKARIAAWGPKLNRMEGTRKVKVNVSESTFAGEDGEEYSSGGKWLEMVVEGDRVYILEQDGELLPLDHSAAPPPALMRTWFLRLVKSLYDRYASSSLDVSQVSQSGDEFELDGSGEAPDGPSDGAANGNALQGRTAASKTGGRRRKGMKRR